MDNRFSQLFILPPRIPPPSKMADPQPDLKITATLEKKNKTKKTGSMKGLLKRILPASKTQKPADPEDIWNQVVGLTKAPTADKASRRGSLIFRKDTTKKDTIKEDTVTKDTKTIPLPELAKSKPNGKTPITVNPPLSTFRRSEFKPSASSYIKSTSSSRDSKFSSISSLPSLHSLQVSSSRSSSRRHSSSPPVTHISIPDLVSLDRLARRIERRLKRLQYLTTHLSSNLVHLFSRKEWQITTQKRMRRGEREVMMKTVFGVKEGVGRVFLRMAVVLQRSLSTLASLKSLLHKTHLSPYPDSIPYATSSTIAALSLTYTLSLDPLHDIYLSLQSDMSLQTSISAEIMKMIESGTRDQRFQATMQDKVMMGRFTAFVADRVELIRGGITDVGGEVNGLGKLGMSIDGRWEEV